MSDEFVHDDPLRSAPPPAAPVQTASSNPPQPASAAAARTAMPWDEDVEASASRPPQEQHAPVPQNPQPVQQAPQTRDAAVRTAWHLQFVVHRAHLGSGTIRQITYYPIEVVPSTAHRQPEGATWFDDHTYVYRRYSEVVKLRRYLMLKYPGELIPSLPAKSMAETFNTAMCDGTTLDQQTRMLALFFDILSVKPRVYAHDNLVSNFLQLPCHASDLPPEGKPETRVGTGARAFSSYPAVVSAIDSEIQRLERDLDKTDPNVFASSATAAMGGLMRSTVKAVSSWWSKADTSEYQVTEAQIVAEVQKQKEYCEWSLIRDKFNTFASELYNVERAAHHAQREITDELVAEKEVASALEALANSLGEDADRDIRELVGNVHELTSSREACAREAARAARQSSAMVFGEHLCVMGIVESIQLLMNRYRYVVSRQLNRVDKFTQQQLQEERVKIVNIAGDLNRNIRSWLMGLRSRILDLGSQQAHKLSASLGALLTAIDSSRAWAAMQSQDYLRIREV